MSEVNATRREPSTDEITAFDAVGYIFQASREMAEMAENHGFSRLAAALELARSLAAEDLATLAVHGQSPSRKAAPEDAA